MELHDQNRKHLDDLFNLSITRIKAQMTAEQAFNPNNILHSVNEKYTLNNRDRRKKVDCTNANNSVHILQKEQYSIPEAAQLTWGQARTSAVDAAKNRNRATFYKEAPGQGIAEYWCFALEKVPPYLMRMASFRDDLQALRTRYAMEAMALAGDHLDREATRGANSASAMKTTAIGIIQQSDPIDAQNIIIKANKGFDIVVANQSGQEFKDLEKRRQLLEGAPPTHSDIVDPVANLVRPPTCVQEKKDTGFQPKGRGKGSTRPYRGGRGYRGRKPYNRN